MSTGTERRTADLEIRAKGRRLEGYAAVFNAATKIGTFTETIRAGAFQLGRDVLALVDHDASRLLARTKSGTLRLSQDTRGLAFDLDVPDTNTGRDLLELAKRNDLGGMSFGFTVPDNGDVWEGDRRELRSIDLYEISVVQSHAAYPGTIVQARSAAGPARVRAALARAYLETLK